MVKEVRTGIYALLHRSDPKIERLAEISLFDGCSRRELAGIARSVDFVHADAGSELNRAGTPADQVLIVAAGSVRVSPNTGPEFIGAKGAVFGEMAVLSRLPYSETLVARGPVEVAVISGGDFRGLLDSVPCLARKVLQRAVKGLRRVA